MTCRKTEPSKGSERRQDNRPRLKGAGRLEDKICPKSQGTGEEPRDFGIKDSVMGTTSLQEIFVVVPVMVRKRTSITKARSKLLRWFRSGPSTRRGTKNLTTKMSLTLLATKIPNLI